MVGRTPYLVHDPDPAARHTYSVRTCSCGVWACCGLERLRSGMCGEGTAVTIMRSPRTERRSFSLGRCSASMKLGLRSSKILRPFRISSLLLSGILSDLISHAMQIAGSSLPIGCTKYYISYDSTAYPTADMGSCIPESGPLFFDQGIAI